jgi:outer membrane immunogenic protein
VNKILFGTAAVLALGISLPASAADMAARPYTKAPVATPPAQIYNWTGFYIGGHVGGAWRDNSNNSAGLTGGNDNDGRLLAGVQAGADYQFAGSSWVIGIEGQYSWLIRDDNNNGFVFPAGPAGGFVYYNNQRSLGSVTGRIGYALGPALLYAKGGYAFAERRDDLFFGGAPFLGTFDRAHRDGYTVGGGLEYMFAPSWSLKGEYMYYNFNRNRFTTPVVLAPFGEWRNDVHTVKVGLNYRFSWGSSGATAF